VLNTSTTLDHPIVETGVS